MCERKGEKGSIHQPFYGTWVTDLMLRPDARKFMLERHLRQTSPMEAKEPFGNACGKNNADSQSDNQIRQDAISRVSALQESTRSLRRLSTHDLKVQPPLDREC